VERYALILSVTFVHTMGTLNHELSFRVANLTNQSGGPSFSKYVYFIPTCTNKSSFPSPVLRAQTNQCHLILFFVSLCPQLPQVKPEVYVFNGFFMTMRSAYVEPTASIYWYTVSWDEEELSWEDFRGAVLGPTDPATAPADSVRGTIYKDWKKLGLPAKPDTGNNGVHASASPFEALAERKNWLEADVAADEFGAALLRAGVGGATIDEFSLDPAVEDPASGKAGSLWDKLEDTNSSDCLRLVKLFALLSTATATCGCGAACTCSPCVAGSGCCKGTGGGQATCCGGKVGCGCGAACTCSSCVAGSGCCKGTGGGQATCCGGKVGCGCGAACTCSSCVAGSGCCKGTGGGQATCCSAKGKAGPKMTSTTVAFLVGGAMGFLLAKTCLKKW